MRAGWMVFMGLMIACGGAPSVATTGVSVPDFLKLECARDLSNAGARLRVSGHALACPLSIDREQDRVLGECDEISAGLERSVVLEYFVLIDGALLVLAQQGGRIDLTSVEEPRQNVVIQPALATRRCLGNLEPAEINFSVCDNDGDGMENLAEYCNEGREPLIAEQSGEP